jgi:cytochrome oxidase Cu insertion factor (SCO1/SenC/PrrC family)
VREFLSLFREKVAGHRTFVTNSELGHLAYMRIFAGTMVLAIFLGTAMGQNKPYPSAQIPSAEGKPAPDFTLKDQDNRNFTLSEQKGKWVLLYFYRGYW